MILNRGGFEARAAYSGEQAIEIASTFAPDMLVTDVIMGDLNGIETAIQMGSLLPQFKVLLFSGQTATANLLVQARERGYEFELLVKPVHPKDLLKKLQDSGAAPGISLHSLRQTFSKDMRELRTHWRSGEGREDQRSGPAPGHQGREAGRVHPLRNIGFNAHRRLGSHILSSDYAIAHTYGGCEPRERPGPFSFSSPQS
jgi:CheY-like chemotaxis protein